MRYIFCSFMFDDPEENIKGSKNPNAASGHKFQAEMLRGLIQNGCHVDVINVPRVRRYPDYHQIIFRKKDFCLDGIKRGTSVGFINLMGLNYLTQINRVEKLLDEYLRNATEEKTVLLVYNTYPAPTYAMRRIKKKYPNVILCDAIGDIYGQYGLSVPKTLHGRLINLIHEKMDQMASECDAFALATAEMSNALGIAEKPFVVVEGMYSVGSDARQECITKESKTIFYAGSLLSEYGIGHLLRAFSLIQDPSYRLIIAGGGDNQDEVERAAAKDSRIRFLGYITPKEVAKNQQAAAVLVNPRTSEHEYVKYSFASKNLECLASGVPYVAHSLPCDPPEYGNYVCYPKDETDQALADKLMEICSLPEEERRSIGEKARQFIATEKNPQRQMMKLDTMLQSI